MVNEGQQQMDPPLPASPAMVHASPYFAPTPPSTTTTTSSSESSSTTCSPPPSKKLEITDGKNGEDETDDSVYNLTTESLDDDEKRRGWWCCCLCTLCCCCYCSSHSGEKKQLLRNPEEQRDGKKVISSCSFSKHQCFLLVVLCCATLTSSFAICLFPPFFPKLAQEKGCSSTIFGLIIGTNCLVCFIVTPIIGKKLRTIGIKFAFTAGLFCSGGCCILSGFLEWFPPGNVFIVMAIMIRACHATANAGVSTSTFAYIGVEFPENVAKVFAWTRTAINLAQMFGPVIGGAMLEVGGFKMPFLVMGTIQMTMTLVAIGLPNDTEDSPDSKESAEVKLLSIFTVKGIWVAFITFVFSTMSNGFLSITLEPQVLRKYDLRELYIGLMFGLKDGANSLTSPLWGWVCDRYHHVKVFILLSSCLAFTSFFLLGPFPGININRTLGVVILALVLNGSGIGGQQVAGVVDAMREAVDAGLPNTADTHGAVAGLWMALSGVGRFTSRAGSGFLVDHMGFRNASVIVVCLHGFVVLMTATFLVRCRGKDHKLGWKASEEETTQQGRTTKVLICTPSEPLTNKTVNIDILSSYRAAVEDSIVCGSSPMTPCTRYARVRLSSTHSNGCP